MDKVFATLAALSLWIGLGGFTVTAPSAGTSVIDSSAVFQSIDGFGAATAYVPTVSSGQADLLWTTSGIGLTLDREFIDCDTTAEGFSGSDQNAALAAARGAKVWYVAGAIPLSFTGQSDCHVITQLPAGQRSAYATFLLNTLQTVQSTYGVSIYALSMQNEPDQSPSYGGSTYDDQQIHDFMAVLGPAFNGSGIKLMIPEPSGWDLLGPYDDTTMNDPTTAAFVNILAAHDYDGASDAQDAHGKKLWETEVSTFGDAMDPSIQNGIGYAQQIHNLLTISNVNAWHFWSIAYISPSTQTDNQCLICDGTVTKRLYTIGNFSKFVRPGYVRIGATDNPVDGVNVSAYKSGNGSGQTIVIVVINSGGPASFSFQLSSFSLTSAGLTPYLTDGGGNNLTAQSPVSCPTRCTVTAPASSVVTYVGTTQ